MTMEFKVRKWLWITLIAVVVLCGGFIYWFYYGNKNASFVSSSPTPIKSITISPTGSASNKTSTPSNGSQTPANGENTAPSGNDQTTAPTVETKTWEGKLAGAGYTDLSCVPDISFQYPKDIPLSGQSSPTMGGGKWLSLGGNANIYIKALSYTQTAQYQQIYCINPPYESVNSYFEKYKTDRPDIQMSNSSGLTINNYPAFRWTETYPSETTTRTIIQNNDKNLVEIEQTKYNSSPQSATNIYDQVLNSFHFK